MRVNEFYFNAKINFFFLFIKIEFIFLIGLAINDKFRIYEMKTRSK